MNTNYITFMSTIRVFVSMVLQFGNECPLSAHAQILITNSLIKGILKHTHTRLIPHYAVHLNTEEKLACMYVMHYALIIGQVL